jgi:hypothetical protein
MDLLLFVDYLIYLFYLFPLLYYSYLFVFLSFSRLTRSHTSPRLIFPASIPPLQLQLPTPTFFIHHESSSAEQGGHQRKSSHCSKLSLLTIPQSLSPEEQRLLRLYGKMPTKKDVLQNKLKVSPISTQPHSTHSTHRSNTLLQERKYFDSGDYALSKAGKASDVGVTNIGSRHPVPENIPHLTSTSPGANNSANNGSVSSQGGQQVPGSISGHPGSVGFQSRSPIKEGGSYLHHGTSISEGEPGSGPASESVRGEQEFSVSPPPAREGVPIRR